MTDPTYLRLILLLTRVYSGANPFFLGKLGGRGEGETALTLGALAEQGLAVEGEGARWTLTETGLAACQPQFPDRPGSIVKYHHPTEKPAATVRTTGRTHGSMRSRTKCAQ
jgi:hypothetical protein